VAASPGPQRAFTGEGTTYRDISFGPLT